MYRKRNKGWLKHLDFVIIDLLCLEASFALAFISRHGITSNPYTMNIYQNMLLLLVVFEFGYAFLIDGYKNILKRGYYIEFVSVMKEICLLELLLTFYLFVVKAGDDFSRTVLFLMGIYQFFLTYCVRLCWKKHLLKHQTDEGSRPLLLVTTGDLLEETLGNIRRNNFQTYFITGIVVLGDFAVKTESYDGMTFLQEADMLEWVCRNWVDEVMIVLPQGDTFPTRYMEAFAEMGIVTHYSIMQEFSKNAGRQTAEKICGYLVLTSGIQFISNRQYLTKRVMDLVGGLAGAIITILLTVVLGPVVYIKSPGPIFFTQERVGQNGRKFKMYKFRTMYLDAEERKKALMEQNRVADGMMFKMEDDPRIIGSRFDKNGNYVPGIGNLIRKLSLDEFPQFFNVLKGDMSLVGTRPPTVDEYEKYKLHHKARLSAKPGITGLWQVSGRSEITDFEDVVRLDTEYISNWSIGTDFRILVKTIQVVLTGKGSM